MLVTADSKELRNHRAHLRGPWVLVPTMGALHEGHRALIREARQIAGPEGTVVVSIFVNPLQFDRPGDLSNYPRPLEDDLSSCQDEGVDLVYTPEAETFYTGDHSTTVSESLLTKHLCGATRPGHFDGVCTVVLKLFLLIQPDAAIFGKKDYQQLAVIEKMVRDLAAPIKVHGLPTVREADGLALSSRNLRLSPADRADAPRIRQALLAARSLSSCGEQRPAQYLDTARHHLEKAAPPGFSIDYLSLVDRHTLQPIAKVTQPALLACACFYGSVRLIDNIEIQA